MLAIEFLDEIVFGAREAAWPAIRGDLGLTYAGIGLLLTLPGVVSGVLEPLIGLVGNSSRRRVVVAAGGCAFAGSLALLAGAGSFVVLLAAFALLYPASGALVGLSQATLMDADPGGQERNMARWVLAGSMGVVMGPLAFGVATWLGWGWRGLFFLLAIMTVPLVVVSARLTHGGVPDSTMRESAGALWHALRRRAVLRWLVLTDLADLLGDVLAGFIAVYFVDVVHVSPAIAAWTLVVWATGGLVGDALLVPLLERVSGLTWLRLTAVAALAIYPALLLASGPGPKLVLLALLSLIRAGWYAIPQGRLYGELPENSGVALAVSNIAGLPAQGFPLLLGLLAQRFGLGAALWLCLAAPLALLVGLPGRLPWQSSEITVQE